MTYVRPAAFHAAVILAVLEMDREREIKALVIDDG